MIALYMVLGIIALLLLVAVVKALLFVPRKEILVEKENIEIDLDKAARDLSDMIKCKTISNRDRTLEDDEEFKKFINLLPERFPNIHKSCTRELVGDRAILF